MKKNLIKLLALLPFLFSFQICIAQEEVLNSLIKIVSPVEISNLIKEQGIRYDKAILHDPNKVAAYLNSDFKKALNLGVYSTDLGYSTIYDQSTDALGYLSSVKKNAEGLGVGSFIDFQKILMLAQNKNDLNLLLDETSTTFENMSNHLEKQKKSNLAALMLTGGWIEMLHITCQVAKKQPNQELNNRIVEQRFILGQILEVLKPFQADANTKAITNDLINLNKLLNSYNIEVAKSNASAKKTIIVGGQEIEVNESEELTKDVQLTNADVTRIAGMVSEIRGAIIK
jgi:ribosome-associated protein YbcJ (S4-like RNA binding protein)